MKLVIMPALQKLRPRSVRNGAVVAKYGDKSVYFDLEDIGNSTGQWDFYGSDARSPYNSFQVGYYIVGTRKTYMRVLCFLILGGGSTLAYFSTTSSGDILPIKKGPQLPPELGPRSKI